jgi:hypothetical protein
MKKVYEIIKFGKRDGFYNDGEDIHGFVGQRFTILSGFVGKRFPCAFTGKCELEDFVLTNKDDDNIVWFFQVYVKRIQ